MNVHHTFPSEPENASALYGVASLYLPLIRMFLALTAAYYLAVTVSYLMTDSSFHLLTFCSLAVSSIIAALWMRSRLKPGCTIGQLERACLVGNFALTANLCLYFLIYYDSGRLIYFILMVIIFAMLGVTRRLAITSCLASLAALYSTILIYEPALLEHYVYIGIATSFAALGGSLFMRRVLLEALESKSYAAEQKEEAERAAEQATLLSITDALTGLPNRRAFFQMLSTVASNEIKPGKYLSAILIDLDDFKPVNDTYGHAAGDTLLMKASDRLNAQLPKGAYLARIGGDEFAAILLVDSETEARATGERLCQIMHAPFNLGRVIAYVGATVGVALSGNPKGSPTELVENADYALYNAKRTKKGTCALFTADDAQDMRFLFHVDQALRRANLHEELEVVYQAQYDSIRGEIVGYEALARWHSEELGLVQPTTFISVAESSGLITKVSRVLLKMALEDMMNWPDHLSMSFNLSVHDILDEAAIGDILTLTQESGIAPARICFEITETVVMGDLDQAGKAIQRIVDSGYKVALDDFGSGYSNLAHLHRLPIDKIKIDRSFVRGLSRAGNTSEIISTLLHLSRSLKKDCIIEGIETDAELAIVQSLGGRIFQGFYFGRPISASAVQAFGLEQDVERPRDLHKESA